MTKMLPMLDPFDEIKRLYFTTTAQTIERDIARALDLLTRMPDDDARDRVAGYMHGLADLRKEWKGTAPNKTGLPRRTGNAAKAGRASQAGRPALKKPKA